MMIKNFILMLLFTSLALIACAQQDTVEHGTITVKKKGRKKTLFDQVNDRLVLIDPYGTVIDSGKISFDMVMEKNGKMLTLTSSSNYLTHEMLDQLQAAKDGTIFYFKNIIVRNKEGEPENYPSTVVKADAGFYKKRKLKGDSVIIIPR